MLGRNDPCWCGSEKKYKNCCYPRLPPQSGSTDLSKEYLKKYGIILKTPEQIDGIRRAGHLAAHILEELCRAAKVGVTTNELNKLAVKLHKDAGAIAACLHYGEPPFPKSICTSINEVICHGIPNDVPLQEGDILNIDTTAILDGYYGDCSQMVIIGKTTPERRHIVEVAHECLMRGIAVIKPGVAVSEIGEAIEAYASSQKCSVVHQFVAHGVGIRFHENPQIMHCRNKNRTPLAPGMTFTVEPMINIGVAEAIIDKSDGWTARTADGKPSAQWEHTLVVTPEGCEILTPWKRISQ